jgi:hypothetical protein
MQERTKQKTTYAASFSLTYDVYGDLYCVFYVHKYNADNSCECRRIEGKLAYKYAIALDGAIGKQQLLAHAFSKAKLYEDDPID